MLSEKENRLPYLECSEELINDRFKAREILKLMNIVKEKKFFVNYLVVLAGVTICPGITIGDGVCIDHLKILI
jgi:serine acetyltransferase